jgi:preprotein translocase subunit SecD
MTTDYIERLRHELLRAGASTQRERRSVRVKRALRPLPAVAAAAAFALIAVALVLAWPVNRSDERLVQPADDAVQMTFRVEPSGAAEPTAQVMRDRLAAAGIDDARVSVSSTGLTISAPAADRDAVTALTQRGSVAFYDWERSVLGPDGAPAPADPSVTGGPDAGRAAAVTRAEAEARATEAPGGRVVRAEGGAPDRWFALGGDPALTNADIASAEPSVDPSTQEPVAVVEFTADGHAAFSDLTRDVARRGAARAEAGTDELEAMQHIAMVIDDRIANVPYINFRVVPNGIDGAEGAQIVGGMTPEAARQTAAVINSGPLPAALVSP